MHALVTGGAGFIGSHLVDRLLGEGWEVTVVDNLDPFYNPAIKQKNIEPHLRHSAYQFVHEDIRDLEALRRLSAAFDVIVHLAARVGVRPSIQDPLGYQDVNVRGTHNLLELARQWEVKQFVFASSSSVYGVNPNLPWRESDHVLQPISPYASTKVSGELIGHVYSHLYDIRFIALRLFTVYGPRQRPDLAIHKFARRMLDGMPIPIYGDGTTRRDYTYVDDVVEALRTAMEYVGTPYEIINVGNNHSLDVLDVVRALEESLSVRAQLEYLPPQPGDVPQTWADVEKAEQLLNFRHRTGFREGVIQFVDWLVALDAQ